MQKFTKIKVFTMVFCSISIIGYEFFRHQYLIYVLPKHVDVMIASILYLSGIYGYTQFIFILIENIEKRRQQDEREAKIIFDNCIDGIFVFDHNLLLSDLNQGAEKMCNWTVNQAAGKISMNSLFQFPVNSIDTEHEFDLIEMVQQNVKIEEAMLKKKDGTPVPVSITLTSIPNEKAHLMKTAAIVWDLSERMQMEEVIKGLYEEATQKQHEAEMLYRITQEISSVRDFTDKKMKTTLIKVVKDISKLFQSIEVGLFLYDYAKGDFYLAAMTNEEISGIMENHFHKKLRNEAGRHQGHTRFSFIPIQKDDFVLGYLALLNERKIKISLHQKELMKNIVHNLSILFENAMLYQRMKDVAIVEERERLSREMHDGLAQIISSIHLKIVEIKAQTMEKDQTCCGELVHSLHVLEQIVDEAYMEVRQNLFNLRMPIMSNVSFVDYLKSYLRQYGSWNSIKTRLDVRLSQSTDDLTVLEQSKVHLIRIVQEALANIRRHAVATEVTVVLESDGFTHCTLTIKDNGIGFDPSKNENGGHFGIQYMQERAALFQGKVTIDSEQGQGTMVKILISIGAMQHESNTNIGL